MANSKGSTERPLSPHLQVFRPIITMVMSIFHRITGSANYAGMALFALWLAAAASGPEAYAYAEAAFGSIPGQLVLFGFTWTLIHHALGGIRHLVWDTGRGFELSTANAMAWGTIIGSAGLTLVVWAVVLAVR